MKPLTDAMRGVLRILAAAEKPLTANQIARSLGHARGQDNGKHSHNGRAMAPAQRVIFPLIGLMKRGLVGHGSRPDRLSGTAFVITAEGRRIVGLPIHTSRRA